MNRYGIFFDPVSFLKRLGIQNLTGSIVNMGCGYGTFTIPAAQMHQRLVYALNIDSEMITLPVGIKRATPYCGELPRPLRS